MSLIKMFYRSSVICTKLSVYTKYGVGCENHTKYKPGKNNHDHMK